MQLDPLTANIQQLFNSEPIRTAATSGLSDEEGSFANILYDALATTSSTNAANNNSTLDLLTGENDDLSGMLLDMQKAELALQLTLQIRNKILDAYNEVIRMSV